MIETFNFKKRLKASYLNNTIEITNFETKEKVQSLTLPHSLIVLDIKFSLSGDKIAIISYKDLRVVDIKLNKTIFKTKCYDIIQSVNFNSKEEEIAAISGNGFLRIWNIKNKRMILFQSGIFIRLNLSVNFNEKGDKVLIKGNSFKETIEIEKGW